MRFFAVIMTLVLSLGSPSEMEAYAVLAHEATRDDPGCCSEAEGKASDNGNSETK